MQYTTALARLGGAAERHPLVLYLISLAAGSRATMWSSLKGTARFLGYCDPFDVPWHELRYAHLSALRTWLADRFAPKTGNRWLAAVRGVLRQAYRLGLISTDDYMRALQVEGVKGSREPSGRSLDAAEVRALFASCDRSPLGQRNLAMLALLYGAGLRRAEAAALDVADFQSTPDGGTLRVHGKGNKQRIVQIGVGAARALRDYVERARGTDPGPLLLPTAGPRLVKRRMRAPSLLCSLVSCAARAGIRHASPHDMRRTYCGDLLDEGADLRTVQALMGHADPRTTSGYDRRGERAKAAAAARLPVPYGDE